MGLSDLGLESPDCELGKPLLYKFIWFGCCFVIMQSRQVCEGVYRLQLLDSF
jgi:hypothetical protein